MCKLKLLNRFRKTTISILFVLQFVSSGISQEVGLYGSKIWTGHYEMQDPIGGGAFISLPLLDQSLRLNFDYSYHQNNRKYTGRIIGGFLPADAMSEPELVKSRSWRKSYSITALIKTIHWDKNQVFLGGGYILSRFEGEREGLETDIKSDLWAQSKNGLVLTASYFHMNLFFERLNLFSQVRYQVLGSSTLATDIENTFNGDIEITELLVGLAWSVF